MNTTALNLPPATLVKHGRRVLPTLFALFNSLRIVAYVPTLSAIQSSAHADQHSLFTWLIFLGANATMALWLHEQNGGRLDRAVTINALNALMCGGIAASIVWLRWIQPGQSLFTFI